MVDQHIHVCSAQKLSDYFEDHFLWQNQSNERESLISILPTTSLSRILPIYAYTKVFK